MAQDEATLAGTNPTGAHREPITPLTRGDSVGRYLVVGPIGRGAMGVVYAAYDPELDRRVAIKLLLPRGSDPLAARRRLLREAQAMAKLSHPNVVHVHDAGATGARVWVAMELIEGQTVRAWAEQRPRSWREVVRVFVAAGRGLAAAHALQLAHRDVKPDNIMRDATGQVKMMDFGLARRVAGFEPGTVDPDASDGTRLLAKWRNDATRLDATHVEGWVGTPAYMAPELLAGAEADARTDQFAFCVALWEVLFGERPYAGTTIVAVTTAIADDERRGPPRGHSVPTWLRRAVERGLSHDPEHRWPTLDALLDELGRDRSRRRRAAFALGLAGAMAIGVAWVQSDGSELCTGADTELAGVWDPTRRAAVAEAIGESGVAFAEDVWARVGPRIDAWASAWVVAHEDACTATRRRGVQSEAVLDLRMACLGRARQRLVATVDVLAEPSLAVLERAGGIVDRLPPLDRCADVEALARGVPLPDPSERAVVDGIRADLARAVAEREAGDFAAAARAVARAQDVLADLAYEPIRTELDHERGRIAEAQGRYDEAEAAFRDVRRRGSRLGQDELVVDATIDLMHLLATQGDHVHEVDTLSDIVVGLAGDEATAHDHMVAAKAAARQTAGDYAGAEATYRELLAAHAGEAEGRLASWRTNLAVVVDLQGKYAEGEAEHRAALAGKIEALGPRHPAVASSHNNLGGGLFQQGKDDEAQDEFEAALRIRLEVLGPHHPEVAATRSNLGVVAYRRGDLESALREHEAALAIRRRTLGAEHPDVGMSLSNLGVALMDLGRYKEAESAYRDSARIWSAALGETHPNVGTVAFNLGQLYVLEARWAEAIEALQRSVAIRRASLGDDHPATRKAERLLTQARAGP